MTTLTNIDVSLLRRWRDARTETDRLFELLRPECLYERPIPERHRVVFYIGHLEAFDWNLLSDYLDLKSGSPELDKLFAFGIDPVAGDLPTDEIADWPSITQINEYCNGVRERLDAAIETEDLTSEDELTLIQLLNVAIEHRLMHAETLAYIFHRMDFHTKAKLASYSHRSSDEPFHPSVVRIPTGHATLGLRRDSETFGWDNEFDEHTLHVPEFRIDKFKITNSQFLEFVNAGGYDDRSLWTDDDWKWKTSRSISHPAFWTRRGDAWFWRSMFEEIPLPLDWPVYVSQAESSAYAKWVGAMLPTEQQWHRAAYATESESERLYPWGSTPPSESSVQSYDPQPVQASRFGASAFGVEGLMGEGWEWTSTVFAPFSGFRPFDCYRGYSEPFFDGKHFVLKGGSPTTAASMLRRSFRNWFQPHYQYVYAGFRCVYANPEKERFV